MGNANVEKISRILRRSYPDVRVTSFFGRLKVINVNQNYVDAAGKTLAEYLGTTSYDIKRIAVEINGQIVPKAEYAGTLLKDGDVVEVVSFVGGG